jgi:hypothetical protein
MRRPLIFSALAAALAFCLWREITYALADRLQSPEIRIALAGSVFTFAIAVLIRD